MIMITLFTTGGTFDKVYFDALSEFVIGEPQAPRLFKEGNVRDGFVVESVLKKDSLEMTLDDRLLLRDKVSACDSERILITHGTDTMVDTAKVLAETVDGKTIVLLGAMQPARMRLTDAPFNLGFAYAAVQLLPAGVYIAMSGQVFPHDQVTKNRSVGEFQKI